MKCPTCDHTLATLVAESSQVMMCNRCGTVLSAYFSDPVDAPPKVHRPELVDRARKFAEFLATGVTSGRPDVRSHTAVLIDAWRRLGMSESIQQPEPKGDGI